jgi:DivIVA domain-containing protein
MDLTSLAIQNSQFFTQFFGYNKEEVDDFLDLVQADYEALEANPDVQLTFLSDNILNTKFSRKIVGYNKEQFDKFLAIILADYRMEESRRRNGSLIMLKFSRN